MAKAGARLAPTWDDPLNEIDPAAPEGQGPAAGREGGSPGRWGAWTAGALLVAVLIGGLAYADRLAQEEEKELLTLASAALEPASGSAGGVAFAPDGQTLAVGRPDGTVLLWDVATDRVRGVLAGHRWAVTDLAFAPDGRTLASTAGQPFGEGGEILVWDLAGAGDRKVVWEGPVPAEALAFAPDGRTLAACAGRRVVLWDTATWQERASQTRPAPGEPLGLAFAPDGATLAVIRADGGAETWDLRGGVRAAWQAHARGGRALAFAPDGATVATAGEDRAIRLWDAATGRLVQTLPDLAGLPPLHALAFSPDGRYLAAAGGVTFAPGPVGLWDRAAGQWRPALRGHAAGVADVAFAPDGQTLATVARDRQARVWHLARGQSRALPVGEPDPAR